MQTESHSNPIPIPDNSNPESKPPGRGRPRVLDDAKRREICALVAGGCGLREAARYVRCDINTIRREAERNSQFGDQLRSSEAYAQLSPLRAMQHAAGTHWRAAAWMLERAFPDRFARPEQGAFGARQARQLMNEVLHVISGEISDPFKFERLEKRVRGTFEYYIRSACDRRRSAHKLRQAMQFFDDKDKATGPLAAYGIDIPEFPDFFSPRPLGGRGEGTDSSPRTPHANRRNAPSGQSSSSDARTANHPTDLFPAAPRAKLNNT